MAVWYTVADLVKVKVISENNIGEYGLECMFADCNLGGKWTKLKTPKLPTGEASAMLDNHSLKHKRALGANVGELRNKPLEQTGLPVFKMEWDAYSDSSGTSTEIIM